MLNYIWFFMLTIGLVFGAINGRIAEINRAVLDSATMAITLCISLLGVMCLWTGLMKIAEKSGLIVLITKLVSPILSLLFPEVPKNHPALGTMVMNMVANFLGLGNAATPLGLKAIKHLQLLNKNKDTATNPMCMFLVLNTSAVQLVPATIIALRVSTGSLNPTATTISTWVAAIAASAAGILAAKLFSSMRCFKNGSA